MLGIIFPTDELHDFQRGRAQTTNQITCSYRSGAHAQVPGSTGIACGGNASSLGDLGRFPP